MPAFGWNYRSRSHPSFAERPIRKAWNRAGMRCCACREEDVMQVREAMENPAGKGGERNITFALKPVRNILPATDSNQGYRKAG